jgi:hypothetical protein
MGAAKVPVRAVLPEQEDHSVSVIEDFFCVHHKKPV